ERTPQRPVRLDQLADHAEVERRIGEQVDDGGAGRQYTVLNPQMRAAVHDVVDGPIPTVDGAVVQAQFGKPGYTAVGEHPDRVLAVTNRQQRRKVSDVLLEQVEDRRDPALTEPHAPANALRPEFIRSRVGRLLEERNACLGP